MINLENCNINFKIKEICNKIKKDESLKLVSIWTTLCST